MKKPKKEQESHSAFMARHMESVEQMILEEMRGHPLKKQILSQVRQEKDEYLKADKKAS